MANLKMWMRLLKPNLTINDDSSWHVLVMGIMTLNVAGSLDSPPFKEPVFYQTTSIFLIICKKKKKRSLYHLLNNLQLN